MPKLIRNGGVVADRWTSDEINTLEQWQALPDKSGSAVVLEQDQSPALLIEDCTAIELVVIQFSNFMDGRGFSHARDLREHGYTGELRAAGNFIVDQLHFLQRCGFDSFELSDDCSLEEALSYLDAFSEHYQAAIDEPRPLFRRRS